MIPNSKIPKLRLLHYENSLKLSVIPQLKERENYIRTRMNCVENKQLMVKIRNQTD
jgi:hypothetical protein